MDVFGQNTVDVCRDQPVKVDSW